MRPISQHAKQYATHCANHPKPRTTGITTWAVIAPLLACVLWLSGCKATGTTKPYIGTANISAIRNPTQVEAYRVRTATRTLPPGTPTVAGFPISAGPFALSDGNSRGAQAVLNTSGRYAAPDKPARTFDPQAGFRFINDNEIIDVLVSFSGNTLKVYRNERELGEEDIDSRRGSFVALVKRVFPNDGQMQQLKP